MKKKYEIGYIAGVFDLFHVGHLNLIENAESMCEHLVVGVLTDELVVHFKKHLPVIPFEERIRIVEAIKGVERVVPVTFENIDKMDAWGQLHFDCLFSGDDYRNNDGWNLDKIKLNQLGADIYFFPYTKSTSSTEIRKLMAEGRV